MAGAANPATAQQLQLLQQQQYLQQQQQLTAGLPGATFAPPAPYIINPQEPYVITGKLPTFTLPLHTVFKELTPNEKTTLHPFRVQILNGVLNVELEPR